MEDSKKILRGKIIFSFVVIVLLILGSGIFGWVLTQRIETSNKIIDNIHLFKEAELQLRREEKNLLIRGYSYQRFLQWQKAKEDFHQRFGELIGLNALSKSEIKKIKMNNSLMSETYNRFFDEIKSNTLGNTGKAQFDEQFKKIGRETLNIINNILINEQDSSSKNDSGTDFLILFFLVVFVATATFLIINVLKHL
jgi:Tfp pilus assembly protein PilX